MRYKTFFCFLLAILFPLLVVMAHGAQAAGSKSGGIQVGLVIGGVKKATRAINYEARYTCNAARMKISLAGYTKIRTLKCTGSVYTFTAWSDAHQSNVGFNAVTGQILYL